MNSDERKELKAAAERMARILEWGNPCEVYGGQDYAHDYSADCATLCKWAVARLAADEAERVERDRPIDEEWLESVGWEFYGVYWYLPLPSKRQLAMSQRFGESDILIKNVASTQFVGLGKFSTRGQLLDLLRAVGVTTKDGAK